MINSNDLFPDYSAGIEAAVEYANAELNGLEGRDIEVQVCTIDYNTPDDTQRCANELAAAQVDFAVSTLNQFGTHMQILRGAGIPVLVGTAVSVPDYTTEGVYAVSPGGGCAGTLTAMAKYAVQELGAKRIAVPVLRHPVRRAVLRRQRAEAARRPQGHGRGGRRRPTPARCPTSSVRASPCRRPTPT